MDCTRPYLPILQSFQGEYDNRNQVRQKIAILLTAGSMPRDVVAKAGEAYNCFGIAGFTDSKIFAFNSEKSGMTANIFSVEEDASQVNELAAWLSE